MERFTLCIAVFPLACGLVFAQADSPPSSTAAPQPAATSAPSNGTITLANVRSWRGTLVDANCAAGATAGSSTADNSSAGAQAKDGNASESDANTAPAKHHKDHRNRTDPSQAQGCSVSNSTSAFALKTKDGQMLKFDGVGNSRAAEELKTKWAKNLSAGKPVHAKVSGSINGDTITVTSVD